MDEAKMGFNQFCGPAALSVLTGLDTDECAYAISCVNGKYKVTGVAIADLLEAGKKLGLQFDLVDAVAGRSIFFAATQLSRYDGMYLFLIPKHYITLEIKRGIISLCDNHTKTPIKLQSSARLMQKVERVYQVTKLEAVKPPALTGMEHHAEIVSNRVYIKKIHKFDDGSVKIYPLGSFERPLDNKAFQDIAFAIMKLVDGGN